MAKLGSKAASMFNRAFPERQIYHRSGGTVQYISVSPWQQAMIATSAAAVAGWSAFATLDYMVLSGPGTVDGASTRDVEKYERWVQDLRAKDELSRSLLEERTDAFQRATSEFESRHETLKVLLSALNGEEDIQSTALRGEGSDLLVDASIDVADSRQSRSMPSASATFERAGITGQLNDLSNEQLLFLDDAEDMAVDRAEKARGVLKLTGVSENRIYETVEMGGPLIEFASLASGSDRSSDPIFDQRVNQVAARMEEARHYEEIVSSLPLARPIGVPHRLTSNYGLRVDPFTKRPGWHGGIDMAAYYKAPIIATGPGKVVFAGRKSGYGRVVEVEHGYGFKSRYAHLHSINVKTGDEVVVGDKVGLMGSSGRSTGPHLHYEVLFQNKPYDPAKFLKAGKHVYES